MKVVADHVVRTGLTGSFVPGGDVSTTSSSAASQSFPPTETGSQASSLVTADNPRREFGWTQRTSASSGDCHTQSLSLLVITQQFKKAIIRHKLTKRAIRRITANDSVDVPQHHHCSSYRREEVILGPTMDDSAILTSDNPAIHEICFVCGKKVTPAISIDLDLQCGAINDEGLACTQSLPCQLHHIGEKLAVMGQSIALDQRLKAIMKLKRAASLPRMKDGRRLPFHAEGFSDSEFYESDSDADSDAA
jgi:hypothetical protein